MSLSEIFIEESKEKKQKSLNELQILVNLWAVEKGIFNQSLPKQQLRKTLEEVEELREAVESNDLPEVKDAIGDVAVTLIILATMYDTTLQACLNGAYDVISKRTGKMVDGLFVKDE